jgi:hypothetical protein
MDFCYSNCPIESAAYIHEGNFVLISESRGLDTTAASVSPFSHYDCQTFFPPSLLLDKKKNFILFLVLFLSYFRLGVSALATFFPLVRTKKSTFLILTAFP